MNKCNIHRYTVLVYDVNNGRTICPDCEKEENNFRAKEWRKRMELDGFDES